MKNMETVPTNCNALATNIKHSSEFEVQGLTSHAVELDHLRTIVSEIKRERTVTESLQRDNTMLRQ